MWGIEGDHEQKHLLDIALQAIADLPTPDAEWMQKHLHIYAHAKVVAAKDAKMHADGWTGTNGAYSRPADWRAPGR